LINIIISRFITRVRDHGAERTETKHVSKQLHELEGWSLHKLPESAHVQVPSEN